MKPCLVVDDTKVIRTIASRLMTELHFDVEEAADGAEALAAVGRRMPEVVLLDWEMPVMNGIDFLRALRALPGGGAPIVVFCTSLDDIDHIREALEAGANEYIMKPFDKEIVEAKLIQVGALPGHPES